MREDSENIVHWSGVENLMNRIDPKYFSKKKFICYWSVINNNNKKCYCY